MSGDRYKIDNQESVYFLTPTVASWLDIFTRIEYKDVIVKSLAWCQREKGLSLHAWCLMTNHLHLIISVQSSHNVSGFLRDTKKHTAKETNKLIKKAYL